jgi:glycolate oxidase FAD binding subunit
MASGDAANCRDAERLAVLHLAPKNDVQISDAVYVAAEKNAPFEIVARGSKRAMGRPVATQTILDTSAISGIVKYEPEELVLSVRAATPMKEIEAALAERNQMLGFEPADWGPLFGGPAGAGTIAGAVATNAAGSRRVRAGAVRDHVIGCRFVNGWGEGVKAGGQVIKNVTGFDLPKLMCGAFGTLGVLAEITLRVTPKPAQTATFVLRNCAPKEGLAALRRAAGLPIDATGLSYLPAEVLASQATGITGGNGAAFIRIEGTKPALEEKLALLRHAFAGEDRAVLDDERTTALFRWIGEGAAFAGWGTDLWRLFVPQSAAHEALTQSKAQVWYADWAGGVLWLGLPANEQTSARLRQITMTVGGQASLMRGAESARASLAVFEAEAPARAELTRAVKAAFDPKRLFNPGRMYKDI